jgi:hypothetical protein
LAAAALAAAAFAAATFAAAAPHAASLYIERRATPAKDSGVQGMPMIASAFFTNPTLKEESGRSTIDRKSIDAVSAIGIKNLLIDLLLSYLFLCA